MNFHFWLFPTLDSLSTKCLRRLEIVFGHPNEYEEFQLEAIYWKALDSALVHIARTQKEMEVIQFSVWAYETGNEWRDQATKDVLSRLPEVGSTNVPIKVTCFRQPLALEKVFLSFPQTNLRGHRY